MNVQRQAAEVDDFEAERFERDGMKRVGQTVVRDPDAEADAKDIAQMDLRNQPGMSLGERGILMTSDRLDERFRQVPTAGHLGACVGVAKPDDLALGLFEGDIALLDLLDDLLELIADVGVEDDLAYVVEKAGRVKVFENNAATTMDTFIDITNREAA